jgi:GT2 family glycosyltransferase
MLISIITLNYKKKELTFACVTSLHEQYKDAFAKEEMEVIVVDNDSQDDSVHFLREEIKKKAWKHTTVITNDRNAGFGAGCNLGARSATGKYLLFLNNDTVVKDRGIGSMANYCDEHTDVAILGGQLRNHDGSLQPSTGKFYTLWYALLLLLGGQKLGVLDASPKKVQKVDWVKGALLMIRRDVFEQLRGFDERIFMYTEDMELCYRAKMAGKQIYFYPNVLVEHKDYGSTSRTFAIVNIYRSLLYFYKKHRSPSEYALLKFVMSAKAVVLIAVGTVTRKRYLVDTYQKALGAIQ